MFIKNIFQRIEYISNTNIPKIQKQELINLLINYIVLYFPNWKNNKYYKERLFSCEIPDMFNILKVNSIIKKLETEINETSINGLMMAYRDASSKQYTR